MFLTCMLLALAMVLFAFVSCLWCRCPQFIT
jgi:hypothetical protein